MLFESSAPAQAFDDRSLVEAISQGNREAFAHLLNFSANVVRADLAGYIANAHQASNVFAATYVEVWWLAGCHCEAGIDVMEWIRNILHRRIADGRARLDPAVDLWPSHAEIELATLLRGRPKGGGQPNGGSPPELSDRPVR